MSKTEAAPAAPSRAQATVTLDTPIVRGEQKIEQVVLRKPLAGELRGVALADLLRMDVSALQTVLPRITVPTLTTHDVQTMELPDLLQLGAEMAGFFLTKADRAALYPGT